MDPTTAWNTMRDESLSNDERAAAALDLKGWLANGGFLPRTGMSFGGNTAARFFVDRKVDETLALETA